MMHLIRLATVAFALVGCQDQPTRPQASTTPPPPPQGVAAYVVVDDPGAQPGQTVRVRVEVQVGTAESFKLGSYTGRLRFDPAALEFQRENPVGDGLRIANPAGAAQGEIRFAGASATGFSSLVLYDGSFTVKTAGYAAGLSLTMEELSAARTLANLKPRLTVNRQVFFSRAPEGGH